MYAVRRWSLFCVLAATLLYHVEVEKKTENTMFGVQILKKLWRKWDYVIEYLKARFFNVLIKIDGINLNRRNGRNFVFVCDLIYEFRKRNERKKTLCKIHDPHKVISLTNEIFFLCTGTKICYASSLSINYGG